ERRYPGKKWVSPEEFDDRKSFFVRIDKQKQELEELKAVLRNQATVMKTREDAEYSRALNELTAQKHKAIEAGDVVEATKIEDKMVESYKQHEEASQAYLQSMPATAPPLNTEVNDLAQKFLE